MERIHRTSLGTARPIVGFVAPASPALDAVDIDPGVRVEEWDATTEEGDAFQATGRVPERQPDRVRQGQR